MTALRSLAFNAVFFGWTAVMMVLALPLLPLSRAAVRRVGRFWSWTNLQLVQGICGLGYEIRGRAHLPEGPCIIAAKHQSAWDTLIFNILVESPAYIFKKELLRIPLFGWYLVAAGCIPIDRSGGAGALRRLIGDARRTLEAGRKIVIFPEGTRVAPGAHRPHHPGTAALYTQLGVPVVPVAVNSGLYWGRRSFLKRPGRIVLECLPPIPPGLPRKAFAAELERRIEEATNRLPGIAPAQAQEESAGDAAGPPERAVDKFVN